MNSKDLAIFAKCGDGSFLPRYETEMDSVLKLVDKGLLESDPRGCTPLLDNPNRSVCSVRLSPRGARVLEGVLKILD